MSHSEISRSHNLQEEKISATSLVDFVGNHWSGINTDNNKGTLSTAELLAAEHNSSFSPKEKAMLSLLAENSDLIQELNKGYHGGLSKQDLNNLAGVVRHALDSHLKNQKDPIHSFADTLNSPEFQAKAKQVGDSAFKKVQVDGAAVGAIGAALGTIVGGTAGFAEGLALPGAMAGRLVGGAAGFVAGEVSSGLTGAAEGLWNVMDKSPELAIRSNLISESAGKTGLETGAVLATAGGIGGGTAGFIEGVPGGIVGRVAGTAFGFCAGAVFGGLAGAVHGYFDSETKYRNEYKPRLSTMLEKLY